MWFLRILVLGEWNDLTAIGLRTEPRTDIQVEWGLGLTLGRESVPVRLRRERALPCSSVQLLPRCSLCRSGRPANWGAQSVSQTRRWMAAETSYDGDSAKKVRQRVLWLQTSCDTFVGVSPRLHGLDRTGRSPIDRICKISIGVCTQIQCPHDLRLQAEVHLVKRFRLGASSDCRDERFLGALVDALVTGGWFQCLCG